MSFKKVLISKAITVYNRVQTDFMYNANIRIFFYTNFSENIYPCIVQRITENAWYLTSSKKLPVYNATPIFALKTHHKNSHCAREYTVIKNLFQFFFVVSGSTESSRRKNNTYFITSHTHTKINGTYLFGVIKETHDSLRFISKHKNKNKKQC